MSNFASGSFEVKLTPQADDNPAGRLTIEKIFTGDLVGTSQGQMLAMRTIVDNSAGYVAMERVLGKLHGREGSFALQHSGTMDRGAPSLVITVVPDSGTGDLVGLTGKMDIVVADGRHDYRLDYELPPV